MSEATPEDVVEQEATATRAAPPPPVLDLPTEADPFDVAEQAAPVGAGEQVLSDQDGTGRDLPLEADPADAAEQAVVVEDDEDEHR